MKKKATTRFFFFILFLSLIISSTFTLNMSNVFLNASATGTSLSEMTARAEAIVNYTWTPSQNISTWNGNTYNGKTYFAKGEVVRGVPYTLFTSEVVSWSLCSLAEYKSIASSNYSTTKYCASVGATRTGPVYGSCCADLVCEIFGGSFMNGSTMRYHNVSAIQNSSYSSTEYNVKAINIVAGDALSDTGKSHIIWVGEVTDSYFVIYEQTPPVARKTTISKSSTNSNGYLVYGGKIYSTVTKSKNFSQSHVHNFVTENEYAHPHKQYTKCYGCGEYSYTGNTLYRDSCNDCLALNYVDVWVSQGSNISDLELSEGLVGNNYYIWYKFANSQTGALYDSYGSLNYNAKISIYNPDGTKLHSCEYNNDNNWISVGLNQNGNYRINITITGDISANYDEYFTVRSNGILKFTPQTLNLDLKNKKTGSVELQTEGNFPEGSKAYLDVSNDNISYSRSGGTINVTALKSGKSEIKATAYDSNGTVLCTATAIINVTEPEYIIGYSGNGSTDVPDAQTKYYSSPLTISSYKPQRTGYTFVGWNTQPDGSGTSYNSGATYTENKSVKLYAQWVANSYTVSFYSNGELYSSKPVVYDSVYGTLPVPTRSGYIFNGWFTKSSGGTKITDSTIVSITANQALYAHWTEIKLSSIKIKTVPTTVNYYVGDTLNTSGLTLTAEYSDGTTKTITSGYTCTPVKLTAAGTQTITVNYNGKTATFTVTVSETVKPDEPETKTYTVKWIIDDISIQQFLKVGDTIVEPSTPVKDGYEFVGWTPIVPVTMPDYDITFTAIFIEVKEPVTPDIPSEPIKSDVIKQPSQTTISYGDSIILHVDESKIPDGGNVMWSASNGNFSYSANGTTCTITPEKNGDTVFTATIYDADGNAVSTDEQTMTSKAGFFDKIIAFFKKLFGLTKTIPDIFKY